MQTLEAPSLSTCGFPQGIYIGLLICRPSDENRLTRRPLLHAAAQKTHTKGSSAQSGTAESAFRVAVAAQEPQNAEKPPNVVKDRHTLGGFYVGE